MLTAPGRPSLDLRKNLCRHPNMAYGITGWSPTGAATLSLEFDRLKATGAASTGAYIPMPGLGGGYYVVQARVWSATAQNVSISLDLWDNSEATFLTGASYTEAVAAGAPNVSPTGAVVWSVVWLPDWYGTADARFSVTHSGAGAIWIDEVCVERVTVGDGNGRGFVGAADRHNYKTNPGPNNNGYPEGYSISPQTNVTLGNTGGGLSGSAYLPPTRIRVTATGAVAAGQEIIGYGFGHFTAGQILSASVMAARTGAGQVRARFQILQSGVVILGTASAYSTPTAGTGSLYSPPTITVPATGDYEIRLILDTSSTMVAGNVFEGWRWLQTEGPNTYFDGSSVPEKTRVNSWGEFDGEVGEVSMSAPVTYPAYFDGEQGPTAPITGYGPPWDGLLPQWRWLGEPGFSESVLSTPVESYWLDDDTDTTPSLSIGLAIGGEGSFADEDASRYPGSVSISRDLTGGNLPGQVRGRSGFSKASGQMTVAIPGVTPWRSGPIEPGGTVYLSLDPGLTSPEATIAAGRTTPVFLGEHLVTTIGAPTARGVEKSLDIEQHAPGLNRPPVVPALIPELPWIGEGGLDATYVLDLVLRAAGYYATPKATPTQSTGVYPLLSATMQGSLLCEIGSVQSHFVPGPPRFATLNHHVMWAPIEPAEANFEPAAVPPGLRVEYSNEGSILLGVDLAPSHPNGAFAVELTGTILPVDGESPAVYASRVAEGIHRISIAVQNGRLYLSALNVSGQYAPVSTPIGITKGRIGIEVQGIAGGGVRARATWDRNDGSGVYAWSPWTAEARLTTAPLLYSTAWRIDDFWVGLQDMAISSLVYAQRPDATDELQGELYLADYVRTERLERTAILSLADSPLAGLISVEGQDGWSILQDIATKTQGAMWLAEDGPVYQNRHLMRGATGVVDRVEAQQSLADIPWRTTIKDIADRVEVTYGGVNIETYSGVAGDPRPMIWELTDKIKITNAGTITLKAEWEGAAQGIASFRSAYDTAFPGVPLGYSIYAMAYEEEGGGVQPPNTTLTVTAVQTGPSSADVTVKSNTTKTVWLVNGFGEPTLILRTNLLVTEGEPRIISAGVPAEEATNPLPLDLRPWVQDDQAAADILGWVRSQTERPLPVLANVSIRPNALRQIGDVVSVIDNVDTGLDSKVLLSSLSTDVEPGSFKQSADLTLLDPTFHDLDAAFSDDYEADSITLVNVFRAGEWIDDVLSCVTVRSDTLASVTGDGWLHLQVPSGGAFGSRVYLAPYNEFADWQWVQWMPPVTGRVPVSVRAMFWNTSGVTLYIRAALRFEDHDAPGTYPPTTDTPWVAVAAGAVVNLAQSWTMEYFRSLGSAVPVVVVSTTNGSETMTAGVTYRMRRIAVFLGHGLNPVPYFSGDTPDGGTEIYAWDGAENASSSSAYSTDTGLVVRQNLVPDPRATVAANWGFTAGTSGVANETMVVDAEDGPVLPDGTKIRTYQRVTWTTSNTTTPINAGFTVTGQGIPVAAGEVVSGAIYFRLSQTATSARVALRPWNGANMADLPGTSATLAADVWHRIEVNGQTLGAGVTGINAIRVLISSLIAINGTLDVTGAFLTKAATAGAHLDGDTAGNTGSGPYTYLWLGERGRSVSVRYERDRKSLTFDDLDVLWADMTFDELDAWMSKFSNLDGLEGTL